MHNPYDNYDNQDSSGEYKQIRVEYKRNRSSGRKTDSGAINAGGAIIIIIFVVLCLTIFGLLSFTTAFADKKLADRNLLNIQQYYEADSYAEKKLAQIYNAMYDFYSRNKRDDLKISTSGIENTFDFDLYIEESDEFNGEFSVSYVTPMSDIQAISSKIEFYHDKDKNTLSYKISEWNVVFTAEFDKFEYEDKGIDFVDPFA